MRKFNRASDQMTYVTRRTAERSWGQDLYIIGLSRAGVVKIGRSWDARRRFQEIRRGCPFLAPELAAVFPGRGYMEGRCHRAVAEHRIDSEWFQMTIEEAIEAVGQVLTE